MSKKNNQAGFTIVELMIATAVFGVILLIVTIAILQFSRVYYKGVTENNTQDTARSIVDQIGQAIQFNGGIVTQTATNPSVGTSYGFCVGNQQYSYAIGTQLTDTSPASNQRYHGLVANQISGCTSSTTPQNMSSSSISGRELLSPKMRLSRLQVTNVGGNQYKVSVRVVYGDDDLLTNPTGSDASCKTAEGSQFCAVSDITTIISKRVE
jgi:prepilin-type N-terminal cleavage/methylation domain-containing protein